MLKFNVKIKTAFVAVVNKFRNAGDEGVALIDA